MPDEPIDIRISLEKSVKQLARWTLILYLCVSVVFGVLLYTSFSQRRELRQNVERIDHSLCSFVTDLEARVKQQKEYLEKHPGQEPIPGVHRIDLRLALKRQQATLSSLSGLEC